jgi:hypothetical protein
MSLHIGHFTWADSPAYNCYSNSPSYSGQGNKMTRVTIDAATAAKLEQAHDMIELRDESGRVVGHFLPGPQRDRDGKVIVPLTDEEIEEASRQEGGRSLKEIFDDLSKK